MAAIAWVNVCHSAMEPSPMPHVWYPRGELFSMSSIHPSKFHADAPKGIKRFQIRSHRLLPGAGVGPVCELRGSQQQGRSITFGNFNNKNQYIIWKPQAVTTWVKVNPFFSSRHSAPAFQRHFSWRHC
jgi:hypothetical protein